VKETLPSGAPVRRTVEVGALILAQGMEAAGSAERRTSMEILPVVLLVLIMISLLAETLAAGKAGRAETVGI
jgi:hypothetical protein